MKAPRNRDSQAYSNVIPKLKDVIILGWGGDCQLIILLNFSLIKALLKPCFFEQVRTFSAENQSNIYSEKSRAERNS